MEAPQEIQDLMASMWAGIQRANQERAVIDAKVNPGKYKLSRMMNVNSNYRFYDGGWIDATNTRLEHHTFCWSVNTNIGGQYLTWEEIAEHTHKGKWKQTKRISWSFSVSKKDVMETAKRRRDGWRKHHGSNCMEYKPRR